MRLHEKPNLMRRNPTPVASPIVIQAPAVNDDNHGLQDMDVEHMQDDMNQSEGEQEQAPKEYTTRHPLINGKSRCSFFAHSHYN